VPGNRSFLAFAEVIRILASVRNDRFGQLSAHMIVEQLVLGIGLVMAR
jgi:hypothetical protein